MPCLVSMVQIYNDKTWKTLKAVDTNVYLVLSVLLKGLKEFRWSLIDYSYILVGTFSISTSKLPNGQEEVDLKLKKCLLSSCIVFLMDSLPATYPN